MRWNKVEPPGTGWELQRTLSHTHTHTHTRAPHTTHTYTHTHTHTQIRGGYCVCSIISQRNTTLLDAYLEPSGTSTMELFNYFAKMLHRKCLTGF